MTNEQNVHPEKHLMNDTDNKVLIKYQIMFTSVTHRDCLANKKNHENVARQYITFRVKLCCS